MSDFWVVAEVAGAISDVEDIAERIEDASGAWERVIDDLLDMEQMQFATQGMWLSGGWAPTEGPHPTLDRGGRLRRSLTEEQGPDAIREVAGDGITFGTSVEYAVFHQYGTIHMPARPVIDIRQEDADRWARIIEAWIMGNDLRGLL